MLKAVTRCLCAVIISFSTMLVSAAEFVLEAGMHFGGDDIGDTNVTRTGRGSKAGELMSVGIGATFSPVRNLEVQATIGLKYDLALPFQDDGIFLRGETNLLTFYRPGDWRVGGGLTYHSSPDLSSVETGETEVHFDDAIGGIFEFGYYYAEWFYIGARYTFIDYETQPTTGVNSITLDGNSIGIIGGIRY